jgi:stearoyl-CoA desaturase (Delta-9 desaturase)
MMMPKGTAISRFCWTILVDTPIFALIGGPIAVVVAVQHGLPTHTLITFFVMVFATGLGITLGFHRLFSHRAFTTWRPVEWVLMVLGCMGGQNSPFYWVAHHRTHHRHSDHDGDPHSPHIWAGRRLGLLRGFWHSYFGWWVLANEYNYPNGYNYPKAAVRDLARRPDLAWIDQHWFHFYLTGLGIPALAGFAVGGTGYDALVGLLWGGMFRQLLGLQVAWTISSFCHLWGDRPYATADHSRNSFVLGLLALGEGWHNNHHAFPSSARHGFYWWQPDLTWNVIWLMERVGLVGKVKRPGPLAYSPPVLGDQANI